MDDEDVLAHRCDVCGLYVPFERWRSDMNGHAKFYCEAMPKYGWDAIWGSGNDTTCDVELGPRPPLLHRFLLWLLGDSPLNRGRRMLNLPPVRR